MGRNIGAGIGLGILLVLAGCPGEDRGAPDTADAVAGTDVPAFADVPDVTDVPDVSGSADTPVPTDTPDGGEVAPGCGAGPACTGGLACRAVPGAPQGDPPACLRPVVRLAVISDTHLLPDPTCDRNVRFVEAMGRLAAMAPPVDRIFNTGDNLEVLMCNPEDAEAYLAGGPPIESLEVYKGLIAAHAPGRFQVVLGNHDDRYLGWFTEKTVPLATWLKAFEGTGALPAPWYSVEEGGFNFLVLDSTDLAFDHESNDSPTFGESQLAWLDAQLSRGMPSVVFWHHFIEPPADGAADPSPVMPVLRAHREVVKAAFTGHGHEWRRYAWEGIRFYETTSLWEWAEPAYHVVDCDPETGDVRVLDEDSIPYG